MRFIVFALALLAFSPSSPAQEKNAALHQLFADEWQRGLQDSPENASYNGDTRYNDRWSDISLTAIAQREAADKAALAKLHGIDRKSLSSMDQLNYDTFEWNLKKAIERQQFRAIRWGKI